MKLTDKVTFTIDPMTLTKTLQECGVTQQQIDGGCVEDHLDEFAYNWVRDEADYGWTITPDLTQEYAELGKAYYENNQAKVTEMIKQITQQLNK